MSKKLTTAEFIKIAKEIHGNKYDYSKVIYVNYNTYVIIVCPKHGEFLQKPANHIFLKHNCKKCSSENKSSNIEDFKEKIKKIYGDYYDLSKANYINSRTPIKIICPLHGEFEKTPKRFLTRGCKLCGIINNTYTNEEFIELANKVHNGKYVYFDIKYKNYLTPVEITCSIHGNFKQSPSNHLTGAGCNRCSTRISKSEIEWLDFLNLPNDKFHRQVILILNNKKYKVDGYDPKTKTVYEFNGDYWHGNPKIFPLDKIHPIKNITYGKLYEKTINKQKELESFGYNTIFMWEFDWNKYKKYKYLL